MNYLSLMVSVYIAVFAQAALVIMIFGMPRCTTGSGANVTSASEIPAESLFFRNAFLGDFWRRIG